ncbi:MAG: hypothetical protein IJ408_03195 [Clostridia bacterium]|nr:hypothetical protein [Clostridia bacterium]
MTRLSAKKQILIFIIGSVLNLLLFALTHYTKFPIWLDHTGTLIISLTCGPILGIASLILHTVIVFVFVFRWSALLQMIPILAIVLIIYYFNKDEGKSFYKDLSVALCSASSAFIINTLIFLCCPAPLGRYEYYCEAFAVLTQAGSKLWASIITSGAISFIEVLLSFLILSVLMLILPKRDENLIFKK